MKRMLGLFCCLAFALALLACPQETARGISSGGTLCLTVLLPSLFPFMILSAFLARSGAGELLSIPLRPLTRLLRLPDATGLVLLISMIGGYPAGAQTICALTDASLLGREEAGRLLRCAVNAGPAFVVIAVGERMFHSAALGWRLLGAQICSSLLLCLLFCRTKRGENYAAAKPRGSSPVLSAALVEAVAQATGGILSICSYVLIVSVLLSLLELFPLGLVSRTLLSGLLEVTTGCAAAASLGGKTGALLAAFFLAFSGFSVCFQILAFLLPSGIPLRHFFFVRLLGGILCALLASPFLPPIPDTACTVSLCSSPALSSAADSPNRLLGALCMMAMVAQLLSRVDQKSIKKYWSTWKI